MYYTFFTSPSPWYGVYDFYVALPIRNNFRFKFSPKDFVLRDRLGAGNFGACYEGVQLKANTEKVTQRGELTAEQKKRRVVLKRVNLDKQGIRTDFLKAGTMAKGAAESGYVHVRAAAELRQQ